MYCTPLPNNNNMIFYFGVHLMCCYCQFLFTVISLALAVHSNSRHVSCGSHYNAAYHYGELVNNISITVFLQKHTTLYSNTHNEHLLPSRARSTMGNQGNWPSIVDQSMHTCKYVVMMPIGVVASEELGLRGRGCRR